MWFAQTLYLSKGTSRTFSETALFAFSGLVEKTKTRFLLCKTYEAYESIYSAYHQIVTFCDLLENFWKLN